MPGATQVILLDDPGPETEAIIAGLGLAGYRVRHASTARAFQRLVDRYGPAGSSTVGAVIIDPSADGERAETALHRIKADAGLARLPRVCLMRPGKKAAPDGGAMQLKRPVTSPALVRLLGARLDRPTGGTVVTGKPEAEPGGTSASSSGEAQPEVIGVGDYEIIDEIANGGMGTVFLAQRRNKIGFQRLHAVKLMHPHLVGDAQVRSMFLDEAALASRIHHPNVAAVVDLGIDGTRPYVVMQYVEGCSLAHLLESNQSTGLINLVLPIMLDALAGLRAAHELTDDDGQSLGFVHRDVSPDNILVGLDGIARLTDFGVAKARGRITSTRDGVRKGKLLYQAPEQFTDSSVDARIDLFASGVVLWNALTGRKLFLAESPAGVMRNNLKAPIARPSSINPAVPAALDDVVCRALARNPDERYQTAAEMSTALRRAGTEHGIIGSPEAVGQWVSRVQGGELKVRRRLVQVARQSGGFTDSLPGSSQLAQTADIRETADPSLTALELPPTSSSAAARQATRRRGVRPSLLVGMGSLGGLVVLALTFTLTCDEARPPPANEADPHAAVERVPTTPTAARANEPDEVQDPTLSRTKPVLEAGPTAAPTIPVATPKAEPIDAARAPEGVAEAPSAEPAQQPRKRRTKKSRRPVPRPKSKVARPEPAPTPTSVKPPAQPKTRDPLSSGPEANPYKKGS